MKRLTTDKPSNNTETMLNYAYAKEGEVRLRYANGKEGIRLTEYLSCLAQENGCESATEENILHGDVCSGCDCEVAILNVLAIQAAELRERLKKYEDAEEQGLLVRLPCKVGDTLFFVMNGEIYSGVVRALYWKHHKALGVYSEVRANTTPYATLGASFDDFGKTVFLTREEAEKALKGE